MAVCYLDSSVAVGAVLGDSACARTIKTLRADRLFSSTLLEAEVMATLRREHVDLALASVLFDAISWVSPNRSLRHEIETVLAAGYLRGADTWHLAAALYLAGDTKGLRFLTADARQRAVAERLGFD